VLMVDDDQQVLETLKYILGDSYEPVVARSGAEAVSIVRNQPVDIVLMDLKLPGMSGLEALKLIKDYDSRVGVLMLSASDSAEQAVSALRLGAYDYLTKPFDNDKLLATLERFSEGLKLKSEVAFLREELYEKQGYGEIISKAPVMKKVFDRIMAVCNTASNVLITGESGTGKELVARAIQTMGVRRDKPFVAVNCGAVPSELMESELFGHEKGSFTGAHQRKIGKFEFADTGTLFLDEVSTLPTHLQIKLLRVLQEKSFERVGSNSTIKVDIRVIAATNVDLANEVVKGAFREDLYYRLKVVPIELPPLRERREDIPLLLSHFLEKHSRACNKRISGITDDAMALLREYRWPGNIRELENLVERLVVLAPDGSLITSADLPSGIVHGPSEAGQSADDTDLREAVQAFEKRYITGVLKRTGWNRLEAAGRLNIHRNTLLLKMKELGIHEPVDTGARRPG
ncbi:MAG: sigma-54-dependent Fis family transcriptional regulator, partial [Deltaproteobacteria bacterium]|nr:sigma-54-dependent Fis family transcriptional regulator [Deltaproteobacteria bacterium]